MVITKSLDVLLIEDNSGDVILVEEALKEGRREKISVRLNVVEDGEKAVEYLRKEGAYVGATRPDLIILDLNLPKRNGHEVLAEIKRDENTKNIPVVVLTTSRNDGDVVKSYDMGATCFITKPFGFHQFMEAVRSIKDFWLNLVTLPQK